MYAESTLLGARLAVPRVTERERVETRMPKRAKSSYHHGDLRASLISTAMGMLERGEPFSIRAVARAAGVSAAAPYRHFREREALESALAAEGLRNLKDDLLRNRSLPTTLDELAEFGVAYVEFALRRPALFRLMFGNECETDDPERVQAAAEIHELLASAVMGPFPDSEPRDLALGGWAVVHGLAFLYLERKLPAESIEDAAQQVRASLIAVFAAQSRAEAGVS